MAFRVLVTGGRQFTDYPALRAFLDALLANRLPDVELMTPGGRGVPMLAAKAKAPRAGAAEQRPDAVTQQARDEARSRAVRAEMAVWVEHTRSLLSALYHSADAIVTEVEENPEGDVAKALGHGVRVLKSLHCDLSAADSEACGLYVATPGALPDPLAVARGNR